MEVFMKNLHRIALGICTLSILSTSQSYAYFPFDYLPNAETVKTAAINVVGLVKDNPKPALIGTSIVGAAATGTALYIYKRNQATNKKALDTIAKLQNYKNVITVYRQISSASYAEQQAALEKLAVLEHKTFNEYYDEFSTTVYWLYAYNKELPTSYASTKEALKLALNKFEPAYLMI